MPVALQPNVLSWAEAEALFAERLGQTPASYYALEEWAREQGFTVSRVATYQMVLRVRDQLETVIANGGNLAEFEAWAQSNFPAWSRAYTTTVFRMSVFGSYNGARFRQINEPEIRQTFDILIYDAVADDRTREEHARMGGTEWKRSEFPASWWPPNGFNCRCEVRAVVQQMARDIGARRWNPRTDGDVPSPDRGFTRNYSGREHQTLLNQNILRGLRQALGRT